LLVFLEPKESAAPNFIPWIVCGIVIIIGIGIVVLICCRLKSRRRDGHKILFSQQFSTRRRSLELNTSGIPLTDPASGNSLVRSASGSDEQKKRFHPQRYLKEQIKSISVDSRREVKRSAFTIGDEIGSGNFSNVCRGEIRGVFDKHSKTPVAIKTLKAPVNQEDLDNMIGEIKVLGHVKPHLNLVSMIGSCTTEFKKSEQLWVLLEFCEYGDLRNYLLGNRWNILSGSQSDPINSRCLVKWAYDIANGMHFLESKSIMHGDLAARNILLDEDPLKYGYPLAKISDFGLAKQFFNNSEYEKVSRMVVPWKWMAFEYLTEEYFTMKSDVWSFGVMFWEIFAFGRTPYGFQEYIDVLQQLESGYRLDCPKEVQTIVDWSPQTLYQTLSDACFVANPKERASFSDVVDILEKEMSELEVSKYVQMSENYQSTNTNNYLKFGRHLSTVSN
jgi:serine/threonine protein kinase